MATNLTKKDLATATPAIAGRRGASPAAEAYVAANPDLRGPVAALREAVAGLFPASDIFIDYRADPDDGSPALMLNVYVDVPEHQAQEVLSQFHAGGFPPAARPLDDLAVLLAYGR